MRNIIVVKWVVMMIFVMINIIQQEMKTKSKIFRSWKQGQRCSQNHPVGSASSSKDSEGRTLIIVFFIIKYHHDIMMTIILIMFNCTLMSGNVFVKTSEVDSWLRNAKNPFLEFLFQSQTDWTGICLCSLIEILFCYFVFLWSSSQSLFNDNNHCPHQWHHHHPHYDPQCSMPNAQVPELLIYDETQYVVDRLDEVIINQRDDLNERDRSLASDEVIQ